VDHVKTELMPDFDFDAFNHENDGDGEGGDMVGDTSSNDQIEVASGETKESSESSESSETSDNGSSEEVDKW
ncbi:MAG: DNA-binding protein, partial [Chitinophagaceae bacterium]